MLDNVLPTDQLRALASRNGSPYEHKSVRHALVEQELAEGWSVARKGKTVTRLRRGKSHHKAMEDRVWTLFYRMGFSSLSGQGGAKLQLGVTGDKAFSNQLDIVAVDEDIALVVECKSALQPRKFSDFSAVLGKHIARRDALTRALRSQLPSATRRPCIFVIWTSGIITTDADKVRALDAGVALLDDNDLSYYEALASQIGQAARYQFLADLLQGRAVPGLELTVPAIRTKMGSFVAYTFSVRPEYLLKIAFVSHRARGKASDIDAYQRMLKKSRLKSIRQYISDGGIFPTNIVVNIAHQKWLAFDRGRQETDHKDSTFGWLHIRPSYRVAWIIDGQHRLFAYAGHAKAQQEMISVMAFVGLPPSEQARLFVDINAEQRKVKQSLLQELYAELHWDAPEVATRVQAILSKAIQALDTRLSSPFLGRILKADDSRTPARCISLTSVFRALERADLFVAKTKKGQVTQYGPFWAGDNEESLVRTIEAIEGYFGVIKEEAQALWALGSAEGGGLAMNDGVTVCINVLGSVLTHLQTVEHLDLQDLSNDELLAVLTPYARVVGQYFAGLTAEQLSQFRALRGIQGQTTGTRKVEQRLHQQAPTFNPAGLNDYLERERAQTTTKAFQVIQRIEQILQATVVDELKSEFGEEESGWWFGGVPKAVRKKVDDRINEEGGKKGGREDNFDLIDYREIIEGNWNLFETILARGKGSKGTRTKWIVDVNELRKPVMHASKGVSLPITEEQLALLEQTEAWLHTQINAAEYDAA